MFSNAFVFFDIGDTLASVQISASGVDIKKMIVLPEVTEVLAKLRAEGVHLGILSNRGAIAEEKVNAALDNVGLLKLFDSRLILYGPKNSPLLFEKAADIVRGESADNKEESQILLFVGENASERSFAQAANFLVASHPRLALDILRQH